MMSQATTYPWQTLFAWRDGPYYGYVRDVDTAAKIITLFSYTTGTSYAVTRASKDFGNFSITSSGNALHVIRFEDDGRIKHGTKINLKGCPFMLVGAKLMECHQGPCRHRQQRHMNSRNKVPRGTKKNGCSAAVYLRELITFPQYKIQTSCNQYRKRKIETSEQLRTDMQSTNYEDIRTDKLIFIDLPSPSMHTGHTVGEAADIRAPIDRCVVNYINSMVDTGITDTAVMKHHIKTYVNSLFEPDKLPTVMSRRFFPSCKDVRKLIYRRCRLNSKTSCDQDSSQNDSEASENDVTRPSDEQSVTSMLTPSPDDTASSVGDAKHLEMLCLDRAMKRCKDVLSKITDLTSTVNSVSALEKATEQLNMIYKSLQASTVSMDQTDKCKIGKLTMESSLPSKRRRLKARSRRKQTVKEAVSSQVVAMKTGAAETPEKMKLGVSTKAGEKEVPVQLHRGIWYYVDGHHNVLSLENNWLTDKVASSEDPPSCPGSGVTVCQDPASSYRPMAAMTPNCASFHGPVGPTSSHRPVDEAQIAVKHITGVNDIDGPTNEQEETCRSMTHL